MQDSKTPLRSIREDVLQVSREDVVRRVRRLSVSTYIRAEDGQRVQYSTAQNIVNAINAVASEQGKASYTLEDLGITLE